MKRIEFQLGLLVLVALFAVGVHAKQDKPVQPNKVQQQAAPVQQKNDPEPEKIAPAGPQAQVQPVRIPQTTPVGRSKQGYTMVTDVLDGFGGESESDNYRIPVNSGGQPSAIGISDSDTLVIEAGFVHAAKIRRGDANSDQVIDLGDIVYLLNYLFKGDIPPCPMETGDATCNGVVDLGDVIYLLNYLFKGGDPPAC